MHNKQKLLTAAILVACSSISTQTHAALQTGSTLVFDAGVASSYGKILTGSYFGMDTNGDGQIKANERTAIAMNNGLIVGSLQDASGSHSGAPDGTEAPNIDAPWSFFGNTGMHYTLSAANIVTSNGANASLDFSGWGVVWNGISRIDMSANAWETYANGVNPDSVAIVTCAVDCANGDTFTLQYSATVPPGDPSGFGGVAYNTFLTGTISFPNTPPTAGDVTISKAPAALFIWVPVVSDPDTGQALTCSITTDGNNGGATVTSNCSAGTYSPTNGAGFTGTDSFIYTVNDGNLGTATGTVSVSIQNNPAPACPSLTTAGNSGQFNTIALNTGANACSNTPDPTTLAVSANSSKGGTVVVSTATQVAVYMPAFGFSGTDTYTYTIDNINSGGSISPAATVTVNVKATGGGAPTSSDGSLSCGDTAGTSSTDCVVTTADIGVPDNGSSAEQGIVQSCIGGCYDFKVSGLTAGSEAQAVLVLSAAIPAPSAGNSIVYRKLTSTGWVSFDTSGNNAIHSVVAITSGSDTICPPAADSAYDLSPGLSTGNQCVRLTITDGGPNDADGVADGTVTDPGGLAETFSIDTRTSGTDGCSMTGKPGRASEHADWWLLSAFIGLLGWFSLKRKKA